MTGERMVRWFAAALASAALTASSALGQGETTLVPLGSTWRYLDNGSNQGTSWQGPTFDDSGWASGAAKLGYGDEDIVTEVSYGPFGFFKYTTTYFRHAFEVADPNAFTGLEVGLERDDAVVVHLNGQELVRDNFLQGVPIEFDTWALTNIDGADEDVLNLHLVPADLLVAGTNVLAVEVHQSSALSSDIGFDLRLRATTDADVVRGPYLQRGTPTGMTIRWRTDVPTIGRVAYGPSPTQLTSFVDELGASTIEHEIELEGLAPRTRYYYSIGMGGTVLAGADADHFFETNPIVGEDAPMRIWALGDSGTANENARAVRDAFYSMNGSPRPDLWLMLGDNAYENGTDAEYQAAVFEMYPETLRQSVLWPTRGNHEVLGSVHYGAFTLPSQGEAGGLASGTEAYYSFDYGNVHFVCLESFYANLLVGGPMWTWLQADLAATDQDWIVAYWHHPPYSKGSHDSDTELQHILMRANFLPLLEEAGVDLVLSGHSHCYERSYLIDGHYGFSSNFGPQHMKDPGNGRPQEDGAYEKTPGPHQGAVYCVAGSSGKTSGGTFDHPAMYYSVSVLGSVVIDIDGGRMDVKFLNSLGVVEDWFSILSYADEGLAVETASVSLTSGGVQVFELDAGVPNGGRPYLLLGSAGGTSPGLPLGIGVLPLNAPDAYFDYTLTNPNGAGLIDTFGNLDPMGRATAAVTVPSNLGPGLIGQILHHAYLALELPGSGAVSFVSNAVPLTFLP